MLFARPSMPIAAITRATPAAALSPSKVDGEATRQGARAATRIRDVSNFSSYFGASLAFKFKPNSHQRLKTFRRWRRQNRFGGPAFWCGLTKNQ
jgi:hypothetical protein